MLVVTHVAANYEFNVVRMRTHHTWLDLSRYSYDYRESDRMHSVFTLCHLFQIARTVSILTH